MIQPAICSCVAVLPHDTKVPDRDISLPLNICLRAGPFLPFLLNIAHLSILETRRMELSREVFGSLKLRSTASYEYDGEAKLSLESVHSRDMYG